MRTDKGIALPLVMGLLLAVSLIGLGLLSQTILSTRFFEAASMSYIGLQAARQQLEQQLDTPPSPSDPWKDYLLYSAVGKDQSNLASTVLFAVRSPKLGLNHGFLSGNVWYPGTCGEYYRNYNESPGVPVTYSDETKIYTYAYSASRRDGRFDESSFLFKDQAGDNGTDVLKTWTNYTVHMEFNADYSPGFGVYFNAYPHPDNTIHTLSGYLFEISPYNQFTKQNEVEHNSTLYTAEVQNGNQNPSSGSRHTVQFSSVGDTNLASWTGATSAGVGALYDAWHSIDISVQSTPAENNPSNTSSNTVIVKVDNVQVLSFTDSSGTIFSPGLIGLGNTAGNNWQSSVGFRNIMVTNNAP